MCKKKNKQCIEKIEPIKTFPWTNSFELWQKSWENAIKLYSIQRRKKRVCWNVTFRWCKNKTKKTWTYFHLRNPWKVVHIFLLTCINLHSLTRTIYTSQIPFLGQYVRDIAQHTYSRQYKFRSTLHLHSFYLSLL